MARTIFLLAALVASVSLGAQQPMSPNQPQGAPQNIISVNPPSAPVVVVGGGLYGPSVFTAPVAGFAATQPTIGATSTGFVSGSPGISLNATPYLGVTSTLGPAPLVYEGGQTGYAYAPGAAAVPAESAAAPGRLINDIAPSKYVGTLAPAPSGEVVNLTPPPPPVSLGEVAASYRAVAPHPINVYVNPAGQQLEPTNVITGAAIASNVIPRIFMVPETQTAGAAATQAQPPRQPLALAPAPPLAQEMAANTAPQQPAAPAQTQQTAPTAQTQAQPGQGETNKPAQTQTKPAQTETNQEPTRLPATSTLLPLLGLLGLLSTGLGLWVLRARR